MVARFSVEEIDRAVYNALRVQAVSMGLLPDALLYIDNPSAYDAAKLAIGSSLVEIYGPGSAASKGENSRNRIVVSRKGGDAGGIGGWPSVEYVAVPPVAGHARWERRDLPASTEDYSYDIRSITTTAKMDRVLHNLIRAAIPLLGIMYSYNSTLTTRSDKYFNVSRGQNILLNDGDWKERLYKVEITDIWPEVEPSEISGVYIVPLTSVNLYAHTDNDAAVRIGVPE